MSEMRDLIDTELDAVCGGQFDFGNIVTQTNTATQVGVAVGGPSLLSAFSSNAVVAQFLAQQNNSSI
jgi:hypothetical protein